MPLVYTIIFVKQIVKCDSPRQGPPGGNTIREIDCILKISFKHFYIKKLWHMITERSLIKNLNLMILNRII
jgi:hypothetical protein